MNRLHRIALACAGALTLAITGAAMDSKLDISNWKEILPEPAFTKLVDDSVKSLLLYTSSPSQFNQSGKKIQIEANNLIIYSEIALRSGNKSGAALRETATALLAAAKAKKGDDAKKLAGELKTYKTAAAKSSDDGDLTKSTSIKLVMDGVKDIDKNLTQYKRLTTATLTAKGKAEEVTAAMYKLAAMSVATTAHVPSEMPKGKTAKDWLSAAEDMRKHSLTAALAARDKKLTELKKAVNDLSASCSKCHDDFRTESN
ncbi:MAG: hypothetical protein U0796_14380 [Gemmatales bacterium]